MLHRSQLYFLFGLWVSFTGFLMAGVVLLPQRLPSEGLLSASVYQSSSHEELREASTVSRIGKVIFVDAGSKTISLYDNNQRLKIYPIASLAAPGAIWEAESGKYAVEKKEYKHFSPFGNAWFPYSIQISGNVFIHGDPEGGSEGKTAGSVHLSTSDAKEVFDFSDIGTQIVVTGAPPRDAFPAESRYYFDGEGTLPPVLAPSFIVADVDSGEVLWERSADQAVNPGSLVTFPTALTAVEHIDPYKTVRIGDVILDQSVVHRRVPSRDDELELGSLIYPLLFSTNDTAGTTYEKVLGTSQFVSLMNDRAKEIGMEDTIYAPGLSEGNSTTTARDLFKLLSYIDHDQHFLIDVSLRNESSLFASSGKERLHWENKNPWIISGDGRYRGGLSDEDANGKGDAAVLFSLPVSEFDDRTVAIILFNSPDVEHDVSLMREFVSTHYAYGVKRVITETEEQLTFSQVLKKKINNLANLRYIFDVDLTYDRRL